MRNEYVQVLAADLSRGDLVVNVGMVQEVAHLQGFFVAVQFEATSWSLATGVPEQTDHTVIYHGGEGVVLLRTPAEREDKQ